LRLTASPEILDRHLPAASGPVFGDRTRDLGIRDAGFKTFSALPRRVPDAIFDERRMNRAFGQRSGGLR